MLWLYETQEQQQIYYSVVWLLHNYYIKEALPKTKQYNFSNQNL